MKATTPWPWAARSAEAQPSYCLSSRVNRFQRASVSLNGLLWLSEISSLLELVAEQDVLEL